MLSIEADESASMMFHALHGAITNIFCYSPVLIYVCGRGLSIGKRSCGPNSIKQVGRDPSQFIVNGFVGCTEDDIHCGSQTSLRHAVNVRCRACDVLPLSIFDNI